MSKNPQDLYEVLRNTDTVFPVIPDLRKEKVLRMDFSSKNKALYKINLDNTEEFSRYVFSSIKESGAVAGVGGYAENRMIYKRSKVFDTLEEPRTVHLGIDIWLPSQTQVLCPLKGTVHSFADNSAFGDYGPTIILKHEIDAIEFYTLYGHLSRNSLNNLYPGKEFEPGEEIAKLGEIEENVQWPPHLHFQIMIDPGNKKGDYPGVCKFTEKDNYLRNCPNPNLILKLDVIYS